MVSLLAVEGRAPSDVWYEGSPVHEVWNESTLVWERPALWRAVTHSTIEGTGTAYSALTAVRSDTPRTVLSGHRIIVPTRCPDSFSAAVTATGYVTGGRIAYSNLRIVVNGSEVATSSNTSSPGMCTVSATVRLTPGASLEMHYRGEGQFFRRPSLDAGASLRVEPAGYV